SVRVMTVVTNNQIVIGGFFTNYNGTAIITSNILLATGTSATNIIIVGLSNSTPPMTLISAVTNIYTTNVVFAGFTNLNTTFVGGRLARLQTNGVLDFSFNASFNGPVFALAVQQDGKLVVGGSFSTISNVAAPFVTRLNGNGTVDP